MNIKKITTPLHMTYIVSDRAGKFITVENINVGINEMNEVSVNVNISFDRYKIHHVTEVFLHAYLCNERGDVIKRLFSHNFISPYGSGEISFNIYSDNIYSFCREELISLVKIDIDSKKYRLCANMLSFDYYISGGYQLDPLEKEELFTVKNYLPALLRLYGDRFTKKQKKILLYRFNLEGELRARKDVCDKLDIPIEKLTWLEEKANWLILKHLKLREYLY